MLWLKAFHIIAITCWFAGLFYLPRLFVYHAMAEDKASIDQFKIMERKLYRGITYPSMLATVILGLWLLSLNWSYYASQGWLHAKLALVAILIIYHHICGSYVKKFAADLCQRSHRYFRWFNEFPVLILLGAVILAVVRPF